jgi:histidyl-tRNA synthetase
MSEALLIYIAGSLLQQFGIDYQVQINSLGTVEVRREYASKLAAFYRERGRKTKLCNECKKNLQKNVLCLLDCKEDECVKIREEAPQIANFLSEDSKNYFAKVLEYLDEFNINYNFNPYLMRSFGYYDETIFEFWPTAENGALGKFSLAGGGRYNNLVEQLGGRSMSAVGLSMGLERIVNKMKDRALENKKAEKNLVFIAQLSDQAKIKALRLFEDLRQYGFNVKQSLVVNSLKIQLEEANVLQSKIALIMGKKEVVDETVLFRDMESGVQEVVSFKKIKEKLEKRFRDSVV